MSRDLFLKGALLILVGLLAGGVVGMGLYRWESATRVTDQPAAALPAASETPPPAPAQSNGTLRAPSAAVDSAAGQAVYAQLCDACHPGGGSGLGPALFGQEFQARYGDDESLGDIIRVGLDGMPGFPEARIPETELAELITFIRQIAGRGPSSAEARPTPTEVSVLGEMTWTGSYRTDIQPILDENCISCHGPILAENGLDLSSYAGTMKGTRGGAVVIPESAGSSTLVWVIQGLVAPEIRMPHSERPLSPNRIQNIVLWIDAGALDD